MQLLLWHEPPLVNAGDPHAFPQLPQLLLFEVRLTSQPFAGLPSQLPKPGVQLVTKQDPALHAELALASEHVFPHTPQLLGSEPRLTQAPLQLVSPG